MDKEKIDSEPAILFVDRHSIKTQHLSGNISFISSFIKAFESNMSNILVYYYCNKSSKKQVVEWLKKLKIKDIYVTTSIKDIFDRKTPIQYIYLYPRYRHFIIYLFRLIRGREQIAVSHGHLNSYHTNRMFKHVVTNRVKSIFYSLFETIIVYSEYIQRKAKGTLPKKISKKIFVITELIKIDAAESV